MEQFKDVEGIAGLQCSYSGKFLKDGKPRKVIYCKLSNGRKATARFMLMIDGKSHYWQAAKLVAQTWLRGYKDGDYLTYKDGDIHNIAASNLIIEDKMGITNIRDATLALRLTRCKNVRGS